MVRILKVNDKNTVPGTVIVVEVATVERDDEINPGRKLHTFRCAAATAARLEDGKWTREKSEVFSEPVKFWSWLNFVRKAGNPVTVFGFGIARSCSLLGLWSLLTSGEFVLNRPPHPNLKNAKSHTARRFMMRTTKGFLLSNGPPTAVVCFHRDRWKLSLFDLVNYLDKSPSDLGNILGLSIGCWPSLTDGVEVWTKAVKERCKISTEFVKRLIVWHNAQELGVFSMTITGVAMAALRHRFMRDRIELPDDQDERDWEREGYFNGRVEALWCGTIQEGRFTAPQHLPRTGELFEDRPVGPFHIVDSRSFYAAVQTFEELPIACIESHVGDNYGPPPLDESLREIMARVVVSSGGETFPVRSETRTLFARGSFQTTLCGPELVRAVRSGSVVSWLGWRRYRLAPCLRWFAEGFWKQRVEAEAKGDRLTAAFCKAIMARLHGKFLQRQSRWQLLPGRQAPAAWSEWVGRDLVNKVERHFRSIGWDVQIREDGGDGKWCFPALAAWVTSHGREYLRHWQNVAGSHHCLYVATDSLIVDNQGLDNLTRHGLVWPDGVGSLRVVRSHPDIEIRGPNNYTHDGRVVLSGAPVDNLVINGKRWSGKRWQGLEETFKEDDRETITAFPVAGLVDRFTAPGTVGPGGWLQPPYLTTVEKTLCQRQSSMVE